MFIDCGSFTPAQIYYLLIQTIIPRPIAWVLSDNGNGSYNLAPFSFFNAVSSEPPTIMLSVGWKDDTTPKDTWVNIEQRLDFVVHIPDGNLASAVNASAAELRHGDSEINQMELPLEYIEGQRLPFLRNSKAALFCSKYAIYEIGSDRQALILGKIHHIWISDDAVKEQDGRLIVDAKQLNPLARLGGNEYSLLGEILTIKRKH